MQPIGGGLDLFRHSFGISVALLFSGLAVPALAQSQGAEEQAQRLFTEALQLMQSDHCQPAVPLFLESQRLDAAAATLANLATCYARLGKTGSAYSTYQQASRAAALENKPELQKRTNEAAAGLARSLTQLRVVPLGSGGLPTIRINGQIVEDVRTPVPLDPGENIIEATAPGREPWRRTLSANGEGTVMVVEVPDLTLPRETSKEEPKHQLSKPVTFDDSSRHVDLRPYAVIATGFGVAGMAVGTVLALGARSKQNASNAYCDDRYCTQPGMDLREQAHDRAALATWSMGLGLVSVGTAAALWLLSEHRNQDTRGLSVVPWVRVGQTSAGVALEGKL